MAAHKAEVTFGSRAGISRPTNHVSSALEETSAQPARGRVGITPAALAFATFRSPPGTGATPGPAQQSNFWVPAYVSRGQIPMLNLLCSEKIGYE